MATFTVVISCVAGVSMAQCPLPGTQQHKLETANKHSCHVLVGELIAKFGMNPKNFKYECLEVKR